MIASCSLTARRCAPTSAERARNDASSARACARRLSIAGRLARATGVALANAGGPGHPPGGWTAACDGGFVARDLGVPVVVLGPGSVATQAHRPDESVAVDEMVLVARAYALTALRLLG